MSVDDILIIILSLDHDMILAFFPPIITLLVWDWELPNPSPDIVTSVFVIPFEGEMDFMTGIESNTLNDVDIMSESAIPSFSAIVLIVVLELKVKGFK